MPNVKMYVDEAVYPACRDRLATALGPVRDFLCLALSVDVLACQFAVIPVGAMPDLPRVNVEMQILSKPGRTRAGLLALCTQLRGMIEEATETPVAVRLTVLDPETYIALK